MAAAKKVRVESGGCGTSRQTICQFSQLSDELFGEMSD